MGDECTRKRRGGVHGEKMRQIRGGGERFKVETGEDK